MCIYEVVSKIAASVCASFGCEVSGECVSGVQTLPAVAPCWRELLCSVTGESGSQQQSSTAPFPCYRAQTHLPLAPPTLPPVPPPLGMIISPLLHRTIIFQVRSSPSLLSFFMPCFCPCAVLHICTEPVQYVKEVSIHSVQNVISIYLFSLLVNYNFFQCLRKKKWWLWPCILTNMTAAYAVASKAFYSPGKQNYTSEADWLFYLLCLLKNLLSLANSILNVGYSYSLSGHIGHRDFLDCCLYSLKMDTQLDDQQQRLFTTFSLPPQVW